MATQRGAKGPGWLRLGLHGSAIVPCESPRLPQARFNLDLPALCAARPNLFGADPLAKRAAAARSMAQLYSACVRELFSAAAAAAHAVVDDMCPGRASADDVTPYALSHAPHGAPPLAALVAVFVRVLVSAVSIMMR